MNFHPAADIFPMLSHEELVFLAEDIRENGLREPILTFDGMILDGRNRFAACERVGVQPEFKEFKGKDALACVISLNLHRRHLNESQRALVAARLATRPHGNQPKTDSSIEPSPLTQPQAAKLLNVSPASVKRAKVILKNDPIMEGLIDAGKRGLTKAHVSNNSGNNEWYTPEPFVEAARSVMGEIDLDPASSKKANAVIKAKRFFTQDDDGLVQEWKGKVWLNPPYASDLILPFIGKLVASKGVSEAVVLVNNATETKWFQLLASISACVCFPTSRIKFWNPEGLAAAPLQGQAIFYIGRAKVWFAKEFGQFGLICNVVS